MIVSLNGIAIYAMGATAIAATSKTLESKGKFTTAKVIDSSFMILSAGVLIYIIDTAFSALYFGGF